MSTTGRSARPGSWNVPEPGTLAARPSGWPSPPAVPEPGTLAARPSGWPSPPAVPEPGTSLTARQDQVLGLVGLGLTNREIGRRLGIAEKTVKNTVTMVLAKLGLERRTQAAIYVTVRRLTPPPR